MADETEAYKCTSSEETLIEKEYRAENHEDFQPLFNEICLMELLIQDSATLFRLRLNEAALFSIAVCLKSIGYNALCQER